MTELSGTIVVVFMFYVLAMLGIGIWAARVTRSPVEFFLADRSLKAWVTAISSTASSESAWAVLGTAYLDIWSIGCLLPSDCVKILKRIKPSTFQIILKTILMTKVMSCA